MSIDYGLRARARRKLALNILDDKRPTYGLTEQEKEITKLDRLQVSNELKRMSNSDEMLSVAEVFGAKETER